MSMFENNRQPVIQYYKCYFDMTSLFIVSGTRVANEGFTKSDSYFILQNQQLSSFSSHKSNF